MRPSPLRLGVCLGLCLSATISRADTATVNGPSKPGEPRLPPPVVGAEASEAPPAAPDRGVVGGQGAAPAPPAGLKSEDGGGDYGYAGENPEASPPPPTVGAAPRGKGD